MASLSKGKSPSRRKTERPIPTANRDLADQIRQAILDRGVTHYQLGQASQVDPGQIARFMTGERDITVTTAGRLCTALGLRLMERTGKVGRPSAKTARPLDASDE